MFRQPFVQAITKAARHVVYNPIADKLNDIACAIKDSFAVFAHLEMLLHAPPQIGVDFVLQIVREGVPNCTATDFDNRHYHGLTFFQFPSPKLHPPSMPGARASTVDGASVMEIGRK